MSLILFKMGMLFFREFDSLFGIWFYESYFTLFLIKYAI